MTDDHWLTRPATIRGLWVAFGALLAAAVLTDLLIEHRPQFGVDGSFGFHAWFGFASSAILGFGARLLGALLKRKDRYYGS